MKVLDVSMEHVMVFFNCELYDSVVRSNIYVMILIACFYGIFCDCFSGEWLLFPV
jgi:hypothetical protein